MNAPGKRVLLAAPRGFCAGVVRAIQTVEAALERYGAPVYVRHEIVHNQHVVTTLKKKGAVFVDETDQVPDGATVIFSAHGVAPAVHEAAARRNLATIDATCPLVTKVHRETVRFAQEDYDILLIGHDGHEEVTGTLGHAPHRIQLVDGPQDVRSPRPGRDVGRIDRQQGDPMSHAFDQRPPSQHPEQAVQAVTGCPAGGSREDADPRVLRGHASRYAVPADWGSAGSGWQTSAGSGRRPYASWSGVGFLLGW